MTTPDFPSLHPHHSPTNAGESSAHAPAADPNAFIATLNRIGKGAAANGQPCLRPWLVVAGVRPGLLTMRACAPGRRSRARSWQAPPGSHSSRTSHRRGAAHMYGMRHRTPTTSKSP
ncbi:hypothetical protein B9Y63_20175 [Stenotrophomonas maltophilia]|nr:hypothetical protein B9Y63_20175 [Stenotrophomonas maltophilia]